MSEESFVYNRRATDNSRVFDWRLIVATALLALVAFILWDGFHAASERDRITQQNAALISNIRTQEQDQAADRAQAAKERSTLLAQQDVLLKRYDQLYADQKALLQYLRAHGIIVPTQFVVIPERVIVTKVVPAPKASANTSPGKAKGKKK